MDMTDWKGKATEYAREKKQLKKRIKELTQSRDEWKTKSILYKDRADQLAADLNKIKNRLNKIIESQTEP